CPRLDALGDAGIPGRSSPAGRAVELAVLGDRLTASTLRMRHPGPAPPACPRPTLPLPGVSTALGRQQTRWIVFGLTLGFLADLANLLPPFIATGLHQP